MSTCTTTARSETPQPQTSPRPGRLRLKILLSLMIFVVIAGGILKLFWLHFPYGSGPAGPPVPCEAFETVWMNRAVLLLGVGDSVTDGFGASPGLSYFERLVRNPDDESPDMKGICLSAVLPNLEFRNISVSGSTSIQALETLREDFETQSPDTFGIVVITTGGNDIIHNYGRTPPSEGAMYGAILAEASPWIDAFAHRLDSIMDLLRKRFPGGCHVFIADIYDFTDGCGDVWRVGLPAWPDGIAIHTAYNKAIRRCAEQRENVHLVPMYEEFLGHGFRCRQFWRATYDSDDPYYWYGSNLEDPHDRGYDAIRRLFLIEMAKVLGPHNKATAK